MSAADTRGRGPRARVWALWWVLKVYSSGTQGVLNGPTQERAGTASACTRGDAWRATSRVAHCVLPPPRALAVRDARRVIARCNARPLKPNLREVGGDEDSLGGVPPDRVHAVVVQDHRALACGTSKR